MREFSDETYLFLGGLCASINMMEADAHQLEDEDYCMAHGIQDEEEYNEEEYNDIIGDHWRDIANHVDQGGSYAFETEGDSYSLTLITAEGK